MSHLLYFHSIEVPRFVNVFGAGNKTHRDALLAARPANLMVSKRAETAIINAVNNGVVDGTDEAVEWAMYHAITTKMFGINHKPISPNGCGGAIFDDLESAFEEAKAMKLFKILQRGRDYEFAYVLLSPDDVKLAVKQLKKVAENDDEGYLTEEVLEPFQGAAKKDLAVFGEWG